MRRFRPVAKIWLLQERVLRASFGHWACLALPGAGGGGVVVGSAIAWSDSKLSEVSFMLLYAASALGRASEEVRMLGCAGWPACLLAFSYF
jgi:hypothetical protein